MTGGLRRAWLTISNCSFCCIVVANVSSVCMQILMFGPLFSMSACRCEICRVNAPSIIFTIAYNFHDCHKPLLLTWQVLLSIPIFNSPAPMLHSCLNLITCCPSECAQAIKPFPDSAATSKLEDGYPLNLAGRNTHDLHPHYVSAIVHW